jgi:two-component system LytT family sensor kinase
MRGRLAFWLVVFAGWTILALVFAVSSSLTYALSYQPPRWRYTMTMAATEWHVWAALTPLVAWLARRARITRRANGARWRRIVILAFAGLPIAFVKVTVTRVLRGVTDRGENYFQLSDLSAQYLIYLAIVGGTHAWLYYREAQGRELRTSQLEALLAQTRLQMLSMQLQPHFLFNTLNTIAELVHRQPEAAERMIGGLSHLLRETLHAGLVDRVPLDQELSLLNRYVEIQRGRFGDRLDVRVSIDDPAARAALVPSLLLQPLVENAIKHGIGAKVTAGRIDITAARDGDRLVLAVSDDGRGVTGEVQEGVGLGNCRARLQNLYGPGAHDLTIANRPGGGAVVRISLPWQT